jgi:hypothetical protein
MRTNEGFVDRVVRVTIGIALLTVVAFGPVPGWGFVGLVGFIPLITGLAGYCPTYALIGLDTCGADRAQRRKGESA